MWTVAAAYLPHLSLVPTSLLLTSAYAGHLWIRHTLPRVNLPRPLQHIAALATQQHAQLNTWSNPFSGCPHRARLGIFLLGSISRTRSKYGRPSPSTSCFVCFTSIELLMHAAAANAGCGRSCCSLRQRPHLRHGHGILVFQSLMISGCFTIKLFTSYISKCTIFFGTSFCLTHFRKLDNAVASAAKNSQPSMPIQNLTIYEEECASAPALLQFLCFVAGAHTAVVGTAALQRSPSCAQQRSIGSARLQTLSAN